MIILDTHIWLSSLFGDPKIKSSGLLETIDNNIKKGTAAISSITLWETAMLTSKGRLDLAGNTREWLEKAVAESQVKILEINVDIASDSCNLPGKFHSDPADRIIVATARQNNAKLLTFDKQIIKYAQKGHLKTQAKQPLKNDGMAEV